MGFRRWIPGTVWEHYGSEDEILKITEALQDLYICKNNQQDKLRWGMTPKGTFSIQEAYRIQGGFTQVPDETIWKNLWKANLWPKISIFVLLLTINKNNFNWRKFGKNRVLRALLVFLMKK